MILEFVALGSNDITYAYNLYCETLHSDIEETFGWDEEFQQERFKVEYELNSLYWIYVEEKRVGLTCYTCNENSVHTRLLLITPTCQKVGYGRNAMAKIEEVAKTLNLPVTLSVFRTNNAAYRFYTSIGYTTVSEGDTHLDLVL